MTLGNEEKLHIYYDINRGGGGGETGETVVSLLTTLQ